MTTRQAFIRGTEALWAEQVERYACGMARIEQLGSCSRAHGEVMRAEARSALRSARVERASTLQVRAHRFIWPSAYDAPMAERHDSVLTATLVPVRTGARYELESLADAWLAAAGEAMDGLDYTLRGHLTVKPDAAAYRGANRYRPPSPVRYHADAIVRPFTVDPVGVCDPRAIEYRTDVVGRGYGFQGHRRIVIGDRSQSIGKRVRKARVAAERTTATAKRGKITTWWSCSTRSLPRRWAQATPAQVSVADLCERTIRMSVINAPFELNADHSVIFDGATVRRDEPASRCYPVREYARRAALAGLTID